MIFTIAKSLMDSAPLYKTRKASWTPSTNLPRNSKNKTLEVQSAVEARVDRYEYALFASTLALSLCIFCIIWLRILYLQ